MARLPSPAAPTGTAAVPWASQPKRSIVALPTTDLDGRPVTYDIEVGKRYHGVVSSFSAASKGPQNGLGWDGILTTAIGGGARQVPLRFHYEDPDEARHWGQYPGQLTHRNVTFEVEPGVSSVVQGGEVVQVPCLQARRVWPAGASGL